MSNDATSEPVEIADEWRWVSGTASAISLGAGGTAVFVTQNEAGPVALLAVGVILGLVALAGIIPWRIKFGDTEIELRRAERENSALLDALTDVGKHIDKDVLSQKPSSEQEAIAFAEVLRRLEQSAPSASVEVAKALRYEQQVLTALSSIAEALNATLSDQVRLVDRYEVDGVITGSSNQKVIVEIRASTRTVDRTFIDAMLRRLAVASESIGAQRLLLITREHARRPIGMTLSELKQIEWVVVADTTDASDIDALQTTLKKALAAG